MKMVRHSFASVLFSSGAVEEKPMNHAITRFATIDEVRQSSATLMKALVALTFMQIGAGHVQILAPVLESVAQENKSRIVFTGST